MAVASRVRVTPGFLMARLAGVSPKQTPAHAPQRMHRSRPNGRTMVGRSSTGLAGGACLWHRSLPTHRTGLPLHAHATGHATAGRRSEDLQPRPFGWLRGLRRVAAAAPWSPKETNEPEPKRTCPAQEGAWTGPAWNTAARPGRSVVGRSCFRRFPRTACGDVLRDRRRPDRQRALC